MTKGPNPDEFKMSLMEHLGELRTRLLRFTITVLVLGFGSLVFARELYGLLMRPVLLALPDDASSLIYTSAIEEINVLMKLGLYAGLFLGTPVLLWQLWGFVSPGLYESERKLATPFIFFGTVAFVAGAAFCYFVMLPQMFEFLLRNEEATAIEQRLAVARLNETDALRYLSLGDLDRAGALARTAIGNLEASGEGTVEGAFGITLVPKSSVDAHTRLQSLGRLIDAAVGAPGVNRAALAGAVEKRIEASRAWGAGAFSTAMDLADESASAIVPAFPGHQVDVEDVWRLGRLLGSGQAHAEAVNWTKPMLSMSEQLTLVLVLELAFGVIFELPLVMALLGLVGLVNSRFLFKYQRHAVVVCLILAAVITPTGDAVNMSLMVLPMLACYELGVLVVWLIERRRAKAPPDPDIVA